MAVKPCARCETLGGTTRRGGRTPLRYKTPEGVLCAECRAVWALEPVPPCDECGRLYGSRTGRNPVKPHRHRVDGKLICDPCHYDYKQDQLFLSKTTIEARCLEIQRKKFGPTEEKGPPPHPVREILLRWARRSRNDLNWFFNPGRKDMGSFKDMVSS